MIGYERRQKILEYLEERRSATVRELAEALYVSEASVRRDIAGLEAEGYVSKIYGGVILAKYRNGVVPVTLRDGEHSGIKDELARRASQLIKDGDTVIIDASSTARRIVKYLGSVRDVKIITNNLKIFSECQNPHIRLYCTGGSYSQNNHALIGPAAELYLKNVTADLLFFSSQGITENGVISDASEEENSLRRVMIEQADRTFFLCDSSKIGVQKMFTLCHAASLSGVICDKKLPWEQENKMSKEK